MLCSYSDQILLRDVTELAGWLALQVTPILIKTLPQVHLLNSHDAVKIHWALLQATGEQASTAPFCKHGLAASQTTTLPDLPNRKLDAKYNIPG